jgi:hypothetical protein
MLVLLLVASCYSSSTWAFLQVALAEYLLEEV